MEKRKSVFGITCAVLSFLAIAIPIVNPDAGGRFDVEASNVMPFFTIGLAMVAFVRRENIIWPIIGIVLTGIYIALHYIA
jgi:energy-converting hydrogenase Eha subunit A